jgi:hypothetical protein
MKKNYLLFLVILLCACRKDNSTFVNNANSTAANGKKCLFIESKDSVNNSTFTITYQLDSILASGTNLNNTSQNFYLLPEETSTKFIYTEGTKELKNAKCRLYLNRFGAVDKEVKITLNADNKTFTESTTNLDTYTYNTKNQLVSVENNLNDEKLSIKLSYDDLNRIKEMIFKDEFGDVVRFTNFKFLPNIKNDNYPVIAVTSSQASISFIPSLRNVYITHYELIADGLGEKFTFDLDYSFNNGTVSKMKLRSVIAGTSLELNKSFKYICK